MLSAIIAILGGLIAASSHMAAKNTNAQELLDKLTPYQRLDWCYTHYLGSFQHDWFYRQYGLYGFRLDIGLGSAAAMLIVGFLLSYGLISKYELEKIETAK